MIKMNKIKIMKKKNDIENAEKEVAKMKASPFTDRAWETTHPAFEMMTAEAKQKLNANPDCYVHGDSNPHPDSHEHAYANPLP